MTKREERREWAGRHRAVTQLIDGVAPSTGELYLKHVYRYFEWLGENGGRFKDCSPEELVELQVNAQGRERYEQLDLLQSYIRQRDLRVKTKQCIHAAVRSFYEYNRAPLPSDKKFKMRSDKPPVQGKLDVQGVRKILEASNCRYRAAILCMFQGGMGAHEFEHFNTTAWPDVEKQLKENQPYIVVSQLGRKHGGSYKSRPFYTILGSDAKNALVRYLREERGPIRNGEAIILTAKGYPVTGNTLHKYFLDKAEQVGLIERYTPECPKCGGETRRVLSKTPRKTNQIRYVCNNCGEATPANKYQYRKFKVRYGVNPHELRDVFRSEWEISPAKAVVSDFIMGHNIDPNNYNKFFRNVDYVLSEYRKAESFLNILSEDPRVVSRFEVTDLIRELDRYKEENRELRSRLNGLSQAAEENEDLKARLEKVEQMIEKLIGG